MPDVEIVLEAETGREIMEVIEQTAADVIFTDIRMPDGDGLEVAEFIQKHCPDTVSPSSAGTRILLMHPRQSDMGWRII